MKVPVKGVVLRKGDRGELVIALQKALIALGYDVKADGDFGPKTEDKLDDFQEASGIYADGIAGKMTFEELNEHLSKKGKNDLLFDLGTDDNFAHGSTEHFELVKVDADKHKDGYGLFVLRSDTAERYKKILGEIHSLGGILTSAGGIRPLSDGANASRSACSFHYTGRALDLALSSGMQDPAKDVYAVTRNTDGKWTVWCRTTNTNVPVITLDAYQAKGHKIVKVSDRFFNLTTIFNKHCFKNISPRSGFFTKNIYTSAEWWHFQDETGLVSNRDTFGQELLKIYTESEIKRKFAAWNSVKNYRFGSEWR